MRKYRFNHIAAAGSWDHFHKGHEAFLKKAFEESARVSIGVTSDEMIKSKKFSEALEDYKTRMRSIKSYVENNNLKARAKAVRLNDIYGPALTDKSLDGILVTSATFNGGRAVNKKRKSLGMKPLSLIKAEMVNNLSSELVRAGKVSRQGKLYYDLFDKNKDFALPKSLRPLMARPFGILIPGTLKKRPQGKVVCVGDVVTNIFKEHKFRAEQFIVDLKVEREEKYKSLSDLGFEDGQEYCAAENAAGTITSKLAKAVEAKHKVILVIGEEDLAVIPVVLSVPLGWKVIYGQPGKGVVIVEVTEIKKSEAYNLIKQFKYVK